jgi:two-component system, NarL family, response regulator NreC
MPHRVLLADDHDVVRQGFRALLEREGVDVVGEAADGREAVRLAEALEPDVAVLDLSMPGLNGLDAARTMLRSRPKLGVVLLTMHADEQHVAAALRAGARGYVLKTQAADALTQAIRQVAEGFTYLTPSVTQVVVDAYLAGRDAPPNPLTPRECEVLQLVAEGRTTKEIAGLLDLTVKTAESYRARVMEKLDIHETAGLVRYAIRHGIIQP